MMAGRMCCASELVRKLTLTMICMGGENRQISQKRSWWHEGINQTQCHRLLQPELQWGLIQKMLQQV